MSGAEYVKFVSVQGGPFNSAENIIDFVIPADAYNLRDSFIQLYATVEGTDTNVLAGTPKGIYSTQIVPSTADASGNFHFLNSLFVKNCSATIASRGQIENIRRVDQLRQALDTVAVSSRENKGDAYLSANSMPDGIGDMKLSIFQEFNKNGTVISRNVETPIMIRLGDLMDFFNAEVYDGSKLGEIRVRLEMNLDNKFRGESTYSPNYAAGNGLNKFETVEATAANQVVNQITTMGAGSPARQDGETYRGIRNIGDSPYYVGQRITVTSSNSTQAGNDITDKETQITGLSFDPQTGKQTLTVLPALTTLATIGDKFENVTVSGIVMPAAINVAYTRAEVVMHRYTSMPEADGGVIVYSTFSTEQDVGPTGVAEFQRQYVVEPDADAALILMPLPANDFLSRNTSFSSYRLRLNQVDMTDRDVVKNSPLYYDRTASLLDGMGMRLKNLQFNTGEASSADTDYSSAFGTDADCEFFGTPMPFTNSEKLLQVNINATGGDVPRLTIFKHKPRKIQY